jgi:type II secretory pathway pseudopilin PulG
VAPVLTPISATGRKPTGFTLLEVLGIIVLLGLACTLVYPNFANGAEKTRVQYIGKLLCADIQKLQETAVSEREPAGLSLDDNGYHYNLGEIRVNRVFPEHGFVFEKGDGEMPDATEDEEEWEDEETWDMEDEATLTFNTDGSCNEINIDWQSDHFCGSLQVAADGTVSWKYESKK